MSPRAMFVAAGSALAAAVASHAQTAALDPADFDRLHALIRPQPEESAWLQIPWMTDLWEARRVAAEEGKPILLWEMDGHPLGCT